MKTSPLFLASALAVTALNSAYAQALPPIAIKPGGPAYLPGEILVQFKADVTDAQLGEAFRRGGLNMIKHVQTPAMSDHGNIGLTHALTAMPVPVATRMLSNLPGVEFAEPNWVSTPDAVSNDPSYLDGTLWGVFGDDIPSPIGPAATTNPFGSQAEKAWAAGFVGSRDVFVGIIDSGFQFDHPDLAANVWTNPGEIPGNGIDDDGDGYVDDVHGWNAVNDNGTTYNSVDPSEEGHGTHVTGTVGAVGGNGIGVSGVNWNVTLIAGKCFEGPGTYLDAIQAIDYMTTLRTRKGLNIVAMNNSWSGTAFSQALLDAYTRAAQAGILSICSAGNYTNNNDALPRYPTGFDTTSGAGYNSVISVAAIDQGGNLASFSDYGSTTVDLGAPGVATYSTLPMSSYGFKSGTSMATPHVTGSVALYASTHPGLSALQLRQDLLGTVTPTPSLNGITVTGGRLDVGSLMSIAPTALPAPATPANVGALVVSGAQVNLSWSDQSGNELGFTIERSTNGGNSFALVDTVGAGITAYSDRTVRPGNTYYYRVNAYNPGGTSGYIYASSAVSTPVVTLPAAPTSLTASALVKGGISLAWSDRSNNEDVFQVERQTGSAVWQVIATLSANTTKYTDTTTASRTSYSYRVRASNAAGVSAYSNQVTIKSR